MSTVGMAPSAWLVLLCLALLHASLAHSQPLKNDLPITYAHHYPSDSVRPNVCKIAHKPDRPLNGTSGYVPFIGTSIGRDPQQLVLRLYYSTLDYPVKYFVVVIPERAMSPPHGAIWYEVQHLKDYAQNAVIITCSRTPSVAEGWNAGDDFMCFKHCCCVCTIKDAAVKEAASAGMVCKDLAD